MKIKNDDIQIIAIPTEEYKDLIRENEKIRHELKLLRALIVYASNNNKENKYMQTLQIKQLSPNATLTTRTHTTDAGLDIYASEDTQLVGYRPSRIPTGIAVNIPAGYEGTIRPRSGKSSKT